jgi:hypothetical protein
VNKIKMTDDKLLQDGLARRAERYGAWTLYRYLQPATTQWINLVLINHLKKAGVQAAAIRRKKGGLYRPGARKYIWNLGWNWDEKRLAGSSDACKLFDNHPEIYAWICREMAEP